MANSNLAPGALQKPAKGERLRMKKATFDRAKTALSALYATVYRRDGYKCVACKRAVTVGSPEELKRAHPHHIIPRSLAKKAIKHTTANVCTVCPFCHADIGDKKLVITGNADEALVIERVG
jgi:HNH endonuclease